MLTTPEKGRTLAYTRIEFTNAKGDLVAFGRGCQSCIPFTKLNKTWADHTKFVGKALQHEVGSERAVTELHLLIEPQENVKLSEDGEILVEGEIKD